jgi:hypothetical protein
MIVRERVDFLKSWIDDRLDDIENGKIENPERTIAWYWLKNAGDGSHFAKKDAVFECFHNFVVLSQWGNSIFGIMSRLSEDGGDPAVRASFQKTMSGNFDDANGAPYTPLELCVMELFRVISPNGGSISTIKDARTSALWRITTGEIRRSACGTFRPTGQSLLRSLSGGDQTWPDETENVAIDTKRTSRNPVRRAAKCISGIPIDTASLLL